MLGGLDLLEGASLVEVPALVVAGEYDVTVPPAAMKLIAAALPAARYVEFPDVGHFVELEAPEAFSGLVSDFFRG
jgi:pimeloyl-ACP methyl ester carboxylesterase